ncbi:hypothetical protein [Bradyrhizobium niftali]|uniref:hypothetical protein n=1 Tax=Bradyrhizobium niftali TaxID=2560055 RepID=UPI001F1C5CB8|nr:hypothetical protein [Bradyrhizobium niftali]
MAERAACIMAGGALSRTVPSLLSTHGMTGSTRCQDRTISATFSTARSRTAQSEACHAFARFFKKEKDAHGSDAYFIDRRFRKEWAADRFPAGPAFHPRICLLLDSDPRGLPQEWKGADHPAQRRQSRRDLTPSLKVMREFRVDWISFILTRNAGLVLLVYGGFHALLYIQRRQGTEFKYNIKWPDIGLATASSKVSTILKANHIGRHWKCLGPM